MVGFVVDEENRFEIRLSFTFPDFPDLMPPVSLRVYGIERVENCTYSRKVSIRHNGMETDLRVS
jgi:hypothetical protein